MINYINIILMFSQANIFHKIITPSLPPVKIYLSSAENVTVFIGPECPYPSAIYYPLLMSHIFNEQLEPPVAINNPLWDKTSEEHSSAILIRNIIKTSAWVCVRFNDSYLIYLIKIPKSNFSILSCTYNYGSIRDNIEWVYSTHPLNMCTYSLLTF